MVPGAGSSTGSGTGCGVVGTWVMGGRGAVVQGAGCTGTGYGCTGPTVPLARFPLYH